MTIQLLRQQGYKVNCQHFRLSQTKGAMLPLKYFRLTASQGDIAAKSGLTILFVKSPQGVSYESLAECSKVDVFRRKIGIKIALERLKTKLPIEVPVSNEPH